MVVKFLFCPAELIRLFCRWTARVFGVLIAVTADILRGKGKVVQLWMPSHIGPRVMG